MEKDLFIERILESENLTDELEDQDASWFLDWGIGKLDLVLQGVTDEETAGNKVNSLMAVMRKINRMVGSYARKSPQDLAEDLMVLENLLSEAFNSPVGLSLEPAPVDHQTVAASLSEQSPRQVLEFLTQLPKQPSGVEPCPPEE